MVNQRLLVSANTPLHVCDVIFVTSFLWHFSWRKNVWPSCHLPKNRLVDHQWYSDTCLQFTKWRHMDTANKQRILDVCRQHYSVINSLILTCPEIPQRERTGENWGRGGWGIGPSSHSTTTGSHHSCRSRNRWYTPAMYNTRKPSGFLQNFCAECRLCDQTIKIQRCWSHIACQNYMTSVSVNIACRYLD